jgi:DUF1680 family protein
LKNKDICDKIKCVWEHFPVLSKRRRKMNKVDFNNIKITGGFWKERQDLVRNVTAKAVYDRFYETGRIEVFDFDKNTSVQPHIFWDSDVAKWMEGVAYLLAEKS